MILLEENVKRLHNCLGVPRVLRLSEQVNLQGCSLPHNFFVYTQIYTSLFTTINEKGSELLHAQYLSCIFYRKVLYN